MSVLQDLVNGFTANVAKLAAQINIIKQVVEGDDTTDVADGVGGLLPSFRKIAAGVNAHIPAVLAAVDEAETIIADGQAAVDVSAAGAAASEANILSWAYAVVAAASADALHTNVVVSPNILTSNLTILPAENAIAMFSKIDDGVSLKVAGRLKIIN